MNGPSGATDGSLDFFGSVADAASVVVVLSNLTHVNFPKGSPLGVSEDMIPWKDPSHGTSQQISARAEPLWVCWRLDALEARMGLCRKNSQGEADGAPVFTGGENRRGPYGADCRSGTGDRARDGALCFATPLGSGVESVRVWVNHADVDDGASPGVTCAESRRLPEFEQEVRELRRANEILKRAASFFGAELDRQHRK